MSIAMKLLVSTLLYALGLILAMEVVPERHEVDYFNHKYLKNFSVTFRKLSRNSPHYLNVEMDSTIGVGNNLTIKFNLFEFLGGHYIPTGVVAAHKLCDFLYKEPFLGTMYAKQFPANWSCPFPAGQYHFTNLTIHLENFPYIIPFTYSSMIVRIRVDVQGIFTARNEEVFRWTTFMKMTQKMTDTKKKT